MRRKLLRLSAFTLAEVIIVLGIIGIVAEMTIPGLVASYQEQACVTGLLKFSSELQQSIQSWKTETGCDSSLQSCKAAEGFPSGNTEADWSDFLNTIAKSMKVTANAEWGDFEDTDWIPSVQYNYYGNANSTTLGIYQGASIMNGMARLADGSIFTIYAGNANSGCYELFLDVNGKKMPNRMGKDVFRMLLGCTPNSYMRNNDINYCALLGNSDGGLCDCYGTCDPNSTNPTGRGAMPTSYVILNQKWPDFKTLSGTVGGGFKP